MKTVKSGGKARMQTSIIIPAYKEEEGLPVVLEAIFKIIDDSYEVIVVDDGSPDKTSEKASNFPCKLLKHEHNQGKGQAMKTGVSNAQGKNVIFIDADNTYPVEVILDMVKLLEHCDVVAATRSEGLENIPRFNRVGNFIFSRLMKYLHNCKVKDPLSGLYGLKKAHFERMHLNSRGFTIETELAIKTAKMRLEVTNLPIRYNPRLGEQKLGGIKDGWKILKTIIKERITPSDFIRP